MISDISDKTGVAAFSNHTDEYDRLARIQYWAARHLSELILKYAENIPQGFIREFGSGTGMLTGHLLREFPDRAIVASDISETMVAYLREKYGTESGGRLSTLVENAEEHIPLNGAALLACAFSLQWFQKPVETITSWMQHLPKGGLCFLSWPGRDSFPEWKRIAELSEVPFTGNVLPSAALTDDILAQNSDIKLLYHTREKQILPYDNPVDFFKSMRDIGAGGEVEPISGHRNLLRLVRLWEKLHPDSIEVTHYVHFAAFVKK